MPEGGATIDKDSANRDSAEILHVVTQSTRHKLLLNIVSHPSQAPSLEELKFQNPGNRSSITEHLKKLQKVGVVEKVTLEPGNRTRDLPHNFYTLSEWGREFLEKHELIPTDPRPLQGAYARTEKPEKIQRYENAKRPGQLNKKARGEPETPDQLETILEEYKESGDASQAGEELVDLEDDNDPDTTPNMGILEQLLVTVESLEDRMEKIESEIKTKAENGQG